MHYTLVISFREVQRDRWPTGS